MALNIDQFLNRYDLSGESEITMIRTRNDDASADRINFEDETQDARTEITTASGSEASETHESWIHTLSRTWT